MTAGFEVALRGGVDAAWVARRAIAVNHPPLPRGVRDDVALLVTELVTNAVRHGGAAMDRPLHVELMRDDGRIRVEVVDPGTAFESPTRPVKGDSFGGWGLYLVDQIAETWGVMPAPSGTCVWFEVPSTAST
jgi:anti-sigma regulatory factor (Ser/Thr protein kinase)